METQIGPENAAAGGHRPAPLTWVSRAFSWCEAHYGLDLRSLALFRMGIGTLLLSDLVTRCIDLRAHYTDVGVLTREHLVGGSRQAQSYSLHMLGGDTTSQVLLFLVAGVFASMLLVGYRTRLAALVSWILLCSLQNRNSLVLQGGDDLLRVMLFWSMFVPLAARFSVDAVLSRQDRQAATARTLPSKAGPYPSPPPRLLSLATMVLVMQLFTMYIVSAALKTGPTWHRDGSAIQLALHHHAFASALGQWLRGLPSNILQGLTWQVWWLERCGPLLFFIPWKTFWWRTLGAFVFIGFHLGLFLTLDLGLFPWVAIVCWLVVLPSWFWDGPVYRLSIRTKVLHGIDKLSESAQAFIARRRKRLGPPRPLPRVRPSWLGSLVVLVLASATGYGSAHAMTHGGNLTGERFDLLLLTRLHANWGMFAPDPPYTSGWFVSVAKQKSGAEVDVWNDGQSVSFDPPHLPSASYRRQRWRKLADNIATQNHEGVTRYFLRWLCREWNEDHAELEQIESITLYHMAQTANFPGKGYGPLSKNQLARENCPSLP